MFLSFHLSYYRPTQEDAEKLYFSEIELEEDEREGHISASDRAESQKLDIVVDHILTIKEKKDGDIACSLSYVNCLQELADMQVPTMCRLCQSPVATAAEVTRVGTATYMKWVSMYNMYLFTKTTTPTKQNKTKKQTNKKPILYL